MVDRQLAGMPGCDAAAASFSKATPPACPSLWNRARFFEAVIFLVLLVIVSLYVFENPSGPGALHQALIYVIFPFAIWAALRMEQAGAVTTVFAVSSIAIWGTIHGLGPLRRSRSTKA